MNTQMGFNPRSGSMGGQRQRLNSMSRSNLSTVQDMDSLDDMDMDMDGFDNLAPIEEAPSQFPSVWPATEPAAAAQRQSREQHAESSGPAHIDTIDTISVAAVQL